MKTKQIQIARVYKSGDFIGFGIAVDGVLLDNQKEAKIESGIYTPPSSMLVLLFPPRG